MEFPERKHEDRVFLSRPVTNGDTVWEQAISSVELGLWNRGEITGNKQIHLFLPSLETLETTNKATSCNKCYKLELSVVCGQ